MTLEEAQVLDRDYEIAIGKLEWKIQQLWASRMDDGIAGRIAMMEHEIDELWEKRNMILKYLT